MYLDPVLTGKVNVLEWWSVCKQDLTAFFCRSFPKVIGSLDTCHFNDDDVLLRDPSCYHSSQEVVSSSIKADTYISES
jgi:hypothetical protein